MNYVLIPEEDWKSLNEICLKFANDDHLTDSQSKDWHRIRKKKYPVMERPF